MTPAPRTQSAARSNTGSNLAAAVLAALAAATTTRLLERPRGPDASPAPPAPDRRADELLDDPSRALRPLERRILALTERVEALTRRAGEAAVDPPVPPAAAPGPLDSGEPSAELAALSDEELAKRADYVVRSEPGCLKDFPAARDAWLAYLKRDLPADKRAVALERLSGVYRALGDPWRSEIAAREAIETAGPESVTGKAARLDLVWALHGQGDLTEAYAAAGSLAQSPEIEYRASAQWVIGKLAEEEGDRERARGAYEQCVDLARRKPDLAVWARQVESDVARMR